MRWIVTILPEEADGFEIDALTGTWELIPIPAGNPDEL